MKELHPGHYVPKMIEDWRKFKERCDADEFVSVDGTSKAVSDSAYYMLDVLDTAVCWTINEAAFPLVWNTDIEDFDFEGIRLPYPVMAIEYDFDYPTVLGRPGTPAYIQDPAPKRIIILTEIEGDRFALISCYQPTVRMKKEGEGDILPTDWGVSPLCAVFEYSTFHRLSEWLQGNQILFTDYRKDKTAVGPAVTISLPMYEGAMEPEQIEPLSKDLADEIRVTLGLLAILSCSNTPVKEVEPPAKLNKKRVKSGKAPIPTYRTIHISDHVSRGGREAIGSHASPRAHWRRGHIRNQKTAKGYIRKWIKPTIVNPDAGAPTKPEVVLT